MKKTFAVAILILSLVSLCACQTYEDFADAFLRGDSEEEIVKIGVMEPVSGAYEKAGKLEVEGIELAHEKKPEVLGKKVELVYVDNGSDIELAKGAASQITEKDVSVVLGSYDSALSIAAGEIFQEQEQPAIAATCTNPLVTDACDYYFRTCFVESFEGPAVAQFAIDELKTSNAALLREAEDDYDITVSKSFGDKFKELGGKVISDIEYTKDTDDYTTQLKQVQASGADVVFLPSSPETAVKIVSAAADAGMNVKFVGTSEWDSDVLLEKEYTEIGKLMFFATYFDAEAELTTATTEFLEAYSKKHEDSPDKHEETPDKAVALAYDAYMLALDAIERAGTAEDASKIKSAIESTKDFEGASGMITLNASGDPIKSVAIMSVNNGKFESVFTIDPDFK